MKNELCRVCKSKGSWITPEIYKCNNCSTLYRIFDVNYQTEYIDKDYWFDITKPEWEWVPIEQYNQYNYIKTCLIPGNVVEFGAANGLIAKHIAKEGRQVLIQDLVDIRSDEVIDNKNIKFFAGTFEDTVKLINNETYNNVVMNNVIEHINDIHNVFKEVNRILTPGGKFIFITDDGDNPLSNINAVLAHPEHCFCITRKGVELLCDKYGFTIEKYWNMTDNLIFVSVVKNG